MSKVETGVAGKDIVAIADKVTKIDLVKVVDGTPVAVTEYHDEYLTVLQEYQKKSISDDLDVDIVEAKIKQAKHTSKGLKTYRLGFTNPLKIITASFTDREKKDAQIISEWEAHRDTMLETTFSIAEESIAIELRKLNEEDTSLGINMDVFKSFIEVQRKVKGMLPNDKGILSKASLTKIQTAFDEVAAPIREAKAKEAQIAREQEQFEKYIPNVELNTLAALHAVLITIAQQKEDIDRLYPTIADMAHRALDNKVKTVEANIRGIESNHAREQAEATSKEAKEVDTPLLIEVEDIKNAIDGNSDTWLNEKLERLRVIYKSLTFADNQSVVTKVSSDIETAIEKNRPKEAVAISHEEETKEEQIIRVVSTSFTATGTLENIQKLKQFCQDTGIELQSIKG